MKTVAADLDRALMAMRDQPASLPVEPHGATLLGRSPQRTLIYLRHIAYCRVNGFPLSHEQEVCDTCGSLFAPRSSRHRRCCGKGTLT